VIKILFKMNILCEMMKTNANVITLKLAIDKMESKNLDGNHFVFL